MTIHFAGHELDPRRQELRRGGEVVHVEPQVFDLLTLLLDNSDRIVSKDEILDTIWQGRIVSEAALSSRINAARKAIGDDGAAQNLIRTFHKRGFRFVGEVVRHGRDMEDAVQEGSPEARTGSARREAVSASGRPSIAVLPFANLGQDPDQEYFAYGLAEDVIRLLGRNRWLTVLTRHSTISYRGVEVDPRAVGAELGVRYLVRGSVRRHEGRARITAELIHAEEGSQLWSEAYDLDLADIFDVQDAMAQQIAATIEPELGDVERQAAARKPPENLDAWDCYQRGLWHLWGFTSPGFAEAEALMRRAIEIEPGLARAHAGLAYVQIQRAFYEGPESRPGLVRSAHELAAAAVALDPRDSLCHCVLGRAHCLQRNYPEAVACLQETLALNPSFAQGYFALAFTLVWHARQEEAIALIERAAELSPRDPHLWSFHGTRAYAHFSLSELEPAAFFARKATRLSNTTHRAFSMLVAALGLMGEGGEAEASLAALLARKPGFTIAAARDDFFFCADAAFIDRFAEGLRRAGLPD